MPLFSCDLSKDCKERIFEMMSATERAVRVQRAADTLQETWRFGGYFSGWSFYLDWEEEKKIWWTYYGHKGFWWTKKSKATFERIQSIIQDDPFSTSPIKRYRALQESKKKPNQTPEPTAPSGRGSP